MLGEWYIAKFFEGRGDGDLRSRQDRDCILVVILATQAAPLELQLFEL